MSLNPPPQYATDVNLRARQRLWEHQRTKFDITGWVLDVAGLRSATGQRVLDVGCGNATGTCVAAGYVASIGDHYQAETTRPWHEVVEDVRDAVQREIDRNGAFVGRVRVLT